MDACQLWLTVICMICTQWWGVRVDTSMTPVFRCLQCFFSHVAVRGIQPLWYSTVGTARILDTIPPAVCWAKAMASLRRTWWNGWNKEGILLIHVKQIPRWMFDKRSFEAWIEIVNRNLSFPELLLLIVCCLVSSCFFSVFCTVLWHSRAVACGMRTATTTSLPLERLWSGKLDGQEFAHYTTYPMALSPHFGRVVCRLVRATQQRWMNWIDFKSSSPGDLGWIMWIPTKDRFR